MLHMCTLLITRYILIASERHDTHTRLYVKTTLLSTKTF